MAEERKRKRSGKGGQTHHPQGEFPFVIGEAEPAGDGRRLTVFYRPPGGEPMALLRVVYAPIQDQDLRIVRRPRQLSLVVPWGADAPVVELIQEPEQDLVRFGPQGSAGTQIFLLQQTPERVRLEGTLPDPEGTASVAGAATAEQPLTVAQMPSGTLRSLRMVRTLGGARTGPGTHAFAARELSTAVAHRAVGAMSFPSSALVEDLSTRFREETSLPGLERPLEYQAPPFPFPSEAEERPPEPFPFPLGNPPAPSPPSRRAAAREEVPGAKPAPYRYGQSAYERPSLPAPTAVAPASLPSAGAPASAPSSGAPAAAPAVSSAVGLPAGPPPPPASDSVAAPASPVSQASSSTPAAAPRVETAPTPPAPGTGVPPAGEGISSAPATAAASSPSPGPQPVGAASPTFQQTHGEDTPTAPGSAGPSPTPLRTTDTPSVEAPGSASTAASPEGGAAPTLPNPTAGLPDAPAHLRGPVETVGPQLPAEGPSRRLRATLEPVRTQMPAAGPMDLLLPPPAPPSAAATLPLGRGLPGQLGLQAQAAPLIRGSLPSGAMEAAAQAALPPPAWQAGLTMAGKMGWAAAAVPVVAALASGSPAEAAGGIASSVGQVLQDASALLTPPARRTAEADIPQVTIRELEAPSETTRGSRPAPADTLGILPPAQPGYQPLPPAPVPIPGTLGAGAQAMAARIAEPVVSVPALGNPLATNPAPGEPGHLGLRALETPTITFRGAIPPSLDLPAGSQAAASPEATGGPAAGSSLDAPSGPTTAPDAGTEPSSPRREAQPPTGGERVNPGPAPLTGFEWAQQQQRMATLILPQLAQAGAQAQVYSTLAMSGVPAVSMVGLAGLQALSSFIGGLQSALGAGGSPSAGPAAPTMQLPAVGGGSPPTPSAPSPGAAPASAEGTSPANSTPQPPTGAPAASPAPTRPESVPAAAAPPGAEPAPLTGYEWAVRQAQVAAAVVPQLIGLSQHLQMARQMAGSGTPGVSQAGQAMVQAITAQMAQLQGMLGSGGTDGGRALSATSPSFVDLTSATAPPAGTPSDRMAAAPASPDMPAGASSPEGSPATSFTQRHPTPRMGGAAAAMGTEGLSPTAGSALAANAPGMIIAGPGDGARDEIAVRERSRHPAVGTGAPGTADPHFPSFQPGVGSGVPGGGLPLTLSGQRPLATPPFALSRSATGLPALFAGGPGMRSGPGVLGVPNGLTFRATGGRPLGPHVPLDRSPFGGLIPFGGSTGPAAALLGAGAWSSDLGSGPGASGDGLSSALPSLSTVGLAEARRGEILGGASGLRALLPQFASVSALGSAPAGPVLVRRHEYRYPDTHSTRVNAAPASTPVRPAGPLGYRGRTVAPAQQLTLIHQWRNTGANSDHAGKATSRPAPLRPVFQATFRPTVQLPGFSSVQPRSYAGDGFPVADGFPRTSSSGTILTAAPTHSSRSGSGSVASPHNPSFVAPSWHNSPRQATPSAAGERSEIRPVEVEQALAQIARVHAPRPTMSLLSSSRSTGSGSAPFIQRAETNRPQPQGQPVDQSRLKPGQGLAVKSGNEGEGPSPTEVDLLARQVYRIVKQRLASERERRGGF